MEAGSHTAESTASHAIRWKLRELFGVDLRSLALLRIALGVCVLADLGTRAVDLVALYTDRGVLPRDLTLAIQGRSVYLSVHYWASGHPWLQAGLFSFTAICAVSLLVGWRTRLATAACWYLVSSLQVRQPLVYMGGDSILRMLLFWGLFLPLAARFSVDARQGRVSARGDHHLSGATVALLLQVCLIYWATGIQKTGDLWWNGQAVFYALQSELATPVGVGLRDEPALLEFLNYGTLGIELFGPFLAFVPLQTAAFRLGVIALFWTFHIGLAVCMNIGLFPLFAMTAWLPFLPSRFWQRVDHRRSVDAGLSDARSRIVSWVALGILAYVCVHIAERAALVPSVLPEPVLAIGRVLRLQQTWVMFAPNPPSVSARHELRARLADGTHITHPAGGSIRWAVYLGNFTAPPPRDAPLTQSLRRLASYHCLRANTDHDISQPVERIAVISYVRRLWPDGPTIPRQYTLVDEPCFR